MAIEHILAYLTLIGFIALLLARPIKPACSLCGREGVAFTQAKPPKCKACYNKDRYFRFRCKKCPKRKNVTQSKSYMLYARRFCKKHFAAVEKELIE